MRSLSKLRSECFLLLQILSLLLHEEIPWEYPKQTQTPPQAHLLHTEHSVPARAVLSIESCFKAHFVTVWSALSRHPQPNSIPGITHVSGSSESMDSYSQALPAPSGITQLPASSYSRAMFALQGLSILVRHIQHLFSHQRRTQLAASSCSVDN